MAIIGIIATTDATALNMEHVLFRIAETLATKHKIDLVGAEKVSARISSHFAIYAPQPSTGITRYLPGRSVLSRLHLMRNYIREKRPDMVMAVSSVGINGLAVALAGRIEHVPSAIRITSDIFRVWRTKAGWKHKVRMFIRNNLLGRLAILLADRVVILHDIQRKTLVNRIYPDSKFYTVPQPVSFPKSASREECRITLCRALKIPEKAFIIGSTMRLDADKKIDLMAEIIRNACRADPDVFFVLVGDGTRKNWLMETLQEEKRVCFIDTMPRDHLALYYQAFDKLIHLSGSEGLANVIIEALYCGTPVVATDSGNITRSLVSHISDDQKALTELVLKRGLRVDALPEMLYPEENNRLWLQLIKKTIATAGYPT